ncbi:MAG: DNA polymerase, partial [Bacteroidales bacterium]|nr:DNA polymerase [Bacteroidales bacterium]
KDETSNSIDFNPILGTFGLIKKEVNPKIAKYENLLNEAKDRRTVDMIKGNAKKEGVTINDNGGFISRAERQCVNARVQGGAATMSKRAMIKVHHDEVLKQLGFRLMLAVHDELIGECPKDNADKVADRLCELMKSAALPECVTPFKCDPTIESVWYETDYSDVLRQKYKSMCEESNEAEAFEKLKSTYSECTEEQLVKFLQNS